MLIIARRVGERILIGDDVVVEVLEISGGTVKLGIAAPRRTRIYREELWRAIREENAAAAGSRVDALPRLGRADAGGEERTPSPTPSSSPPPDDGP